MAHVPLTTNFSSRLGALLPRFMLTQQQSARQKTENTMHRTDGKSPKGVGRALVSHT